METIESSFMIHCRYFIAKFFYTVMGMVCIDSTCMPGTNYNAQYHSIVDFHLFCKKSKTAKVQVLRME